MFPPAGLLDEFTGQFPGLGLVDLVPDDLAAEDVDDTDTTRCRAPGPAARRYPSSTPDWGRVPYGWWAGLCPPAPSRAPVVALAVVSNTR